MYKKVSIDASVFLSSFALNECHSSVSREFFSVVKNKGYVVFIPVLTLFEVLHVYYKHTGDPNLTERILQKFINLNASKTLFFLNMEADFVTYFTMHHYKFSLKTSDAIVAITAQKSKCPLVTWDNQIIKACNKHIEAMTPIQFIKKFK